MTVLIFNNRACGILDAELVRADAQNAGHKAEPLLDPRDPDLDFVGIGTGPGIGSRVIDTAEQLTRALDQAIADPGPHLVEVVIPPSPDPRQVPATLGTSRSSDNRLIAEWHG